MKQITHKVYFLLTGALSAIIALLGFGGCKSVHKVKDEGSLKQEHIQPIRLMYGPPVATYRVAGRVTAPNGDAVQNAVVHVYTANDGETYENTENLRTDYDGRYIGVPTRLSMGSAAYAVCDPGTPALSPDTVRFDPYDLASAPAARINFQLRKK